MGLDSGRRPNYKLNVFQRSSIYEGIAPSLDDA